MTDRGVAYDFWLRVRSEQAARGWTDVELQDRSGIPRGTVDRLAKGKRPPLARVVNSLADALGVDRDEAYRLAGRMPAAEDAEAGTDEARVSVREAVLVDPVYTEEQRQAMLQLLDIFEQANQGGGEGRRAG